MQQELGPKWVQPYFLEHLSLLGPCPALVAFVLSSPGGRHFPGPGNVWDLLCFCSLPGSVQGQSRRIRDRCAVRDGFWRSCSGLSLAFPFYFGSRGQPVHISMLSLCRRPMPSISLGGDNFGACQDSPGFSGCAEPRAWAVGAGFWGACGISLFPAGFGELQVSSACCLLSLGQEGAPGRMLQA